MIENRCAELSHYVQIVDVSTHLQHAHCGLTQQIRKSKNDQNQTTTMMSSFPLGTIAGDHFRDYITIFQER